MGHGTWCPFGPEGMASSATALSRRGNNTPIVCSNEGFHPKMEGTWAIPLGTLEVQVDTTQKPNAAGLPLECEPFSWRAPFFKLAGFVSIRRGSKSSRLRVTTPCGWLSKLWSLLGP